MQLRYINLGRVEGAFGFAAWEFARITKPDKITMLSFVLDKKAICSAGLSPVKNYLHIDKIPEDMNVSRIYVSPWKKGELQTRDTISEDGKVMYGRGVGVFSEGTLFLYVYYPHDLKDIPLKTSASLSEILRKQGIKSFQGGNDLYFKTDKEKKFCGTQMQRFGDWTVYDMFISLTVDIDLMEKLFKFDTDKFRKKKFENIGDIVGGLDEVGNITEDILPRIVDGLAKRLNLEVRPDTLTESEKTKLEALAEKLKDDKWGYESIHPEIK